MNDHIRREKDREDLFLMRIVMDLQKNLVFLFLKSYIVI